MKLNFYLLLYCTWNVFRFIFNYPSLYVIIEQVLICLQYSLLLLQATKYHTLTLQIIWGGVFLPCTVMISFRVYHILFFLQTRQNKIEHTRTHTDTSIRTHANTHNVLLHNEAEQKDMWCVMKTSSFSAPQSRQTDKTRWDETSTWTSWCNYYTSVQFCPHRTNVRKSIFFILKICIHGVSQIILNTCWVTHASLRQLMV